MTTDDAARQLQEHVRRFNHGVREGDFGEMLTHLDQEAEMYFAGVPAGPFIGLAAIADAYRENPPDDEIVLLNASADGEGAAGDYAWRSDSTTPAGRLAIRVADGRITRLEVSFR